MLFIWRGWGIVVPIVWFVSLWIVQILTNSVFGAGTYEIYSLPKLIGVIPVSLAIWEIGKALNENITSNSNKHAFFFISVEYWAFIIPIFTLVFRVIL